MTPYRVRLEGFEGPLDLLLFFIRRDEIDIQDIPIGRIADEYLAYVRLLEEIDLDGVADFIYMAAVLIGIKAKMLLPRPELDEAGEPVDPRQELVDRLLEYARYKEAAGTLEAFAERRAERHTRGAASDVPDDDRQSEVTYRVSVFSLVSALRRVLQDAPSAEAHPVRREEYQLEDQMTFLLERLSHGQARFHDLILRQPRAYVIVTFLAVLDLVQRQSVRLRIGVAPDDFYLEAAA